MVSLKYKKLQEKDFQNALFKLLNCTDFGSEQAKYRVGKIIGALVKNIASIRDQYVDEVRKFAQLDEQGEFVRAVEEDPTSFKLIEGKEGEYLEAMSAFDERELEISQLPLGAEALKGAKLTAAELVSIEGILEGFEE